jgi:hypothetical protein
MKPLYFVAAILAFVTALSELYAFQEWAGQKQPSQAPVVFMIGLVGMMLLIVLAQAGLIKPPPPKLKLSPRKYSKG